MKKAYLAISFSKRANFDMMVEGLRVLLEKRGYTLFVFVDNYKFSSDQENEMMRTAFKEIDDSDILIAELTTKAIGVGVEVGYAFSKSKPIIYIRKKGAKYSTTVAGCSDFIMEYDEDNSLESQWPDI